MLPQYPEILSAESLNGSGDLGFAGVIGRGRQLPTSEHGMKVAQVLHSGESGFPNIASLIHPPVDHQAVSLTGGGDELPRADRLGTGASEVVESAFDHCQIDQVFRHSILFKD